MEVFQFLETCHRNEMYSTCFLQEDEEEEEEEEEEEKPMNK
jgi:hypothetical protein